MPTDVSVPHTPGSQGVHTHLSGFHFHGSFIFPYCLALARIDKHTPEAIVELTNAFVSEFKSIEERMGDSWEDEDFDVTVPVVKKANWDDEEDEADLDALEVKPAVQTPEMIARLAKKAEEDAVKLANKLKFAALEKEAPEDRKMRERRLVEEADNELSAELFAGATKAVTASSSVASATAVKPALSKAATLAGISIATKQDHITFGTLVAKKLDGSTSFNIAAFFDTFTETIQNKLSVESLDKCLETLKKIRADRDEKVAKKVESKTKKLAVKAEKKKHEEVFGGANYEEEYADYAGIEDDFM